MSSAHAHTRTHDQVRLHCHSLRDYGGGRGLAPYGPRPPRSSSSFKEKSEERTARPSARTAGEHEPVQPERCASTLETTTPLNPAAAAAAGGHRRVRLPAQLFSTFRFSFLSHRLRWSFRARKCAWRAMDARWKAAAVRMRCARFRAA